MPPARLYGHWGPKIRVERVCTPTDGGQLRIGDVFLLTRKIRSPLPDLPFQATCSEPRVLDSVRVGDRVSLDDGKLQGSIMREDHDGYLVRIAKGKLKGIKLKPGKGLNFPDTQIDLEPLTDKDRDDLDFIAKHADMIGHSFVESADHVALLQAEIARRRSDWRRLGIVAKIETPRAVSNLPEIIVQAAAASPSRS